LRRLERTIEIPATDVQRVAAFYGNVFGHEAESLVDGSLRITGVLAGALGATTIVIRNRSVRDEAAYILFTDNSLEESARRVCLHGGSVVVLTTDMAGVPLGLFRDSEGNPFVIEEVSVHAPPPPNATC
jgi:predicted enzyme related to lactoylglutathione lyase